MNFENIDYLKYGNPIQKQTYELLNKYSIITSLIAFDPILVGTIPIDVNIENSDVDIICYYTDKEQFSKTIRESFNKEDGFRLWDYKGKESAIVANFKLDNFTIEIFGQNTPTKEQLAYRHLLIEYKLLKLKGEEFRQEVIELKRKGFKTEPAFAHLIGLKGDPYTALLTLETLLDT